MTINGELENGEGGKPNQQTCAFNTSLSQQMELEEFRNGQYWKGDKYHYIQCSTFCKALYCLAACHEYTVKDLKSFLRNLDFPFLNESKMHQTRSKLVQVFSQKIC